MSSITVEGRTLAAAMKSVMAVVERRNTIPILSNVRLKSVSSGLALQATDLDIELTTFIDVMDASDQLDITVPAIRLQSIASLAGPAPVKIEVEEQEFSRTNNKGKEEKWSKTVAVITVADGDAVYTLDCLPSSDWPELPNAAGDSIEASRFTNGRLVDLLNVVSPAISTEETRYYLNGVHYKPGMFEATDGHRLIRTTFDKEEEGSWDVIIPRKVVQILAKYAKTDCALHLKPDANRGQAVMPNLRLTFKLIDGTYPNTNRVIPIYDEQAGYRLEFDAVVLRSAVERVVTVSTERGRAVRFRRDLAGKVEVYVENPECGTAAAKTFIDWPEKAEAFGFNGRYLLQMIPKAGRVTFEQNDRGSPCIIKHGDKADELRIVMPMRV